MSNPSEDWIDGIIASRGYTPIWGEDDVKAAIRLAVDLATEKERSVFLWKGAETLWAILDSPVGKAYGTLATSINVTAKEWTRQSKVIREKLEERARAD